MSTPDFIGIYDNALSSEECDELITFFESSKKIKGVVFDSVEKKAIVNPNSKKNVELAKAFVSTTPICMVRSLSKCVEKYVQEYESLSWIPKWNLIDRYTFQKLQYYDDGYKSWHTEHGPPPCSDRILVWMFYLNDAASGTEFMHFPTIEGKMGRCIIWPAAWTHLHKSAPNKGLKYITSGWISHTGQ